MRVVVLLGLVTLAAGSILVEPDGVLGYHERIGIPLATRIKETEDELFAEVSRNNRIVGGAIAPTNAHPYMAGLIISFSNIFGQSACGSSLISSTRLVTAAHCWFDGTNQANQYVVVLGSPYLFHGGIRIATSTVVMHPQWDPTWLHNDIAVIYLPFNAPISASIQPVSLPTGNQLFEQFIGEWAIAAGFGKTSDQQVGVSIDAVVSHVNLRVISVAECHVTYREYVLPSTICTSGIGGVGICGGDSGGPLVLRRNGQDVLIGISSFAAQPGCQLGHPSAFARVTSFMGFINQHM